MSFASSISNDLEIFDNLEAITYTSVRAAGDVIVSVDGALRRAISANELASYQGLHAQQDITTFHIKKSDLTSVEPVKQGDQIIDVDGVTWMVSSFQEQSIRTRYRFIVIKGQS